MKIFKTEQTKLADNFTIENEPITSENLMERAATNATKKITEIYKNQKKYTIFAGIGNNGGDGLVIARLLSQKKNTEITVFIIEYSKKYSKNFILNLQKLKKTNTTIQTIKNNKDKLPQIDKNTVIIDTIFGSGLSREITGLPAKIITYINNLENTKTIAIDIPSGLFGEQNNTNNQTIIKANYTLTFETPFLSFLFPENNKFVGKIITIPIGISPKFIEKTKTNYFLTQKNNIKIKPRKKFSHKGNYGHAMLIAGSYGTTGAAILSAKAAYKSGIGLLTAHVPKKCVNIMQIASPETILNIDKSKKYSTKINITKKINAIGIGPAIGINQKTTKMLFNLIENYKDKKYVIDADAITILSKNKKYIKKLPEKTILTPHPKEFERLAGKTKNSFDQIKLQRKLSIKNNIIIVLKRAYTAISLPNGQIHFNPTGNPGMATAGTGDILTGIILALLAQNYTPEEAAIFGTYIHGKAADIAVKQISQHALTASDIIKYLNNALSH